MQRYLCLTFLILISNVDLAASREPLKTSAVSKQPAKPTFLAKLKKYRIQIAGTTAIGIVATVGGVLLFKPWGKKRPTANPTLPGPKTLVTQSPAEPETPQPQNLANTDTPDTTKPNQRPTHAVSDPLGETDGIAVPLAGQKPPAKNATELMQEKISGIKNFADLKAIACCNQDAEGLTYLMQNIPACLITQDEQTRNAFDDLVCEANNLMFYKQVHHINTFAELETCTVPEYLLPKGIEVKRKSLTANVMQQTIGLRYVMLFQDQINNATTIEKLDALTVPQIIFPLSIGDCPVARENFTKICTQTKEYKKRGQLFK